MVRTHVRRNSIILSVCVAGFLLSMSAFVIGDQMQPQNTTNPPADMIHWLRSILDDDVAAWTIRNHRYHWFEEGLIIGVTDGEGQSVMLLTDGTNVFRMNCASGLQHINRILGSLAFPESNFQDALEVRSLLDDIVYLYHGRGGIIATRRYLESIENLPFGLKQWLHETDTDPSEFRTIWVDPVVQLVEKRWTATFNRVKPDGSVDQWLISGRFHPADERIEVVSVEVTSLKEEGFLYYPIDPSW